MDDVKVSQFVIDVIIVLASGLVSGAIFRRLGVSLLIGYLIVGAAIGQGGLGWVSQEHHELEYLARTGALFLLFAVGIEFSLHELLRLSRFFLVGGAVQMLLVAIPLTIVCFLLAFSWKAALLIGAAAALSSTILVFKALAEWGQTGTQSGKRAIGILLFQDVALVPLMLLIPLLTENGDAPTAAAFAILICKSILFVVAVDVARRIIAKLVIPMLGELQSVELVVLFALTILAGTCWISYIVGLPPAIGALASGLMLSGNRMSKQIDTLVLPFRESFAAVFFVTLGTLLQPMSFFDEPLLMMGGLIGLLTLKSAAAAIALKLTGLSWKASIGMGVGLAQLGEFSFLLIAEGSANGLISDLDYNRMLFLALGSLILTPVLLKFGIRWAGTETAEEPRHHLAECTNEIRWRSAIVIGMGLVGRNMVTRLKSRRVSLTAIDLSPIVLHAFAQEGIQTVAGDARQPRVLRRAGVADSELIVICVSNDDSTRQIVRTLRELNANAFILVRCRLDSNVELVKEAGANAVVSEEVESYEALWGLCEHQLSDRAAQSEFTD